MSLPEIHSEQRGHSFYPDNLDSFPPLYSTEDMRVCDKTVLAHFFGPNQDWWVVEYNPADQIAFGFAFLGSVENAEWGYFSLLELEFATYPQNAAMAHVQGRVMLPFERDLDFQPKLALDAIPEKFHMEWWSEYNM
jgi:hypothetical protein